MTEAELDELVASVKSTGSSRDATKRGLWLGRIGLVVAVFVVSVTAYVTNPQGDSHLVLPTAHSILHERNLNLDEFSSVPNVQNHYGNIEVNEHRYNYFPWAVSLFALPTVAANDAAASIGLTRSTYSRIDAAEAGGLEKATASLIVGLTALVLAMLTFERTPNLAPRRRQIASLAVGAIFALGTSALSVAGRALWQHGPSMLMTSVALLCATRLSKDESSRLRINAVALGASLAVAYAVRPTNAIAILLLGGWVLLFHRRATALVAGGGVLVLLPWCAINLASFGSALPPYNQASRFSVHPDYLNAIAANLVSPARGLIVFTPVVVLVPFGIVLAARGWVIRDRLELCCLAVAIAQLLVVSGLSERWWAGYSFGPRFMSDVLPFVAVMTVPAVAWLASADYRRTKVRVLALLVGVCVLLSVGIHLQGAELVATTCWNGEPINVDVHPYRVWDWSDRQFDRGARVLVRSGLSQARTGSCPPFEPG